MIQWREAVNGAMCVGWQVDSVVEMTVITYISSLANALSVYWTPLQEFRWLSHRVV